MKDKQWAWLALMALVVVGCGGEPERLPPEMQQAAPSDETAAPATSPKASMPPQPAAGAGGGPSPNKPGTDSPIGPPAPGPGPAAPAPAAVVQPSTRQSEEDEQWATEADMAGIRQKAGVGMGKQGHGYGNDPLTYPLAAYFRVRERIFVDQIKHAMDLYQATNGRYPRTQDEFRREIIQAGGMTMAVLPQGHKYYYDPTKGELMVVRPQ